MGYLPSVRSRWLDIGQVLFFRVYGPRLRLGPQIQDGVEVHKHEK